MIPVAAAGMTARTGTGGAAQLDPRLKPAAHEFEACLMKEFLAPLERDSLFADKKDGAGSEGSDNALMGFGAEALARAISERGGFGIATKIITQLEGRAQAGGAAGDTNDSLKINEKSDSSRRVSSR
jgi:Rod binding domain-containing protein